MTTCSICLQESENATDLPCGHSFHPECIVPWLLKSSSCPNCRYTEKTSGDTATITDPQEIRTLINEIRSQRIEQSRQLAANIRKSKKRDAPKQLKKKVTMYESYKSRIKEVNKEKRLLELKLKNQDNEFNEHLSNMYQDYLQKYKDEQKKQKENTKSDRQLLTKTKQRIKHATKRMMEIRFEILEFE